jgi:hypothetical protein
MDAVDYRRRRYGEAASVNRNAGELQAFGSRIECMRAVIVAGKAAGIAELTPVIALGAFHRQSTR